MAQQDIFWKPPFAITRPITADQVQMLWSGSGGNFHVTQATNVQVQYQQNVNRRYTLSSPQNQAAIIPGRPIGTMTIGRLFVSKEDDLFSLDGWNVCNDPATLYLSLTAANATDCATSGIEYVLLGCYATGYSFSANADDLQVVDNITVEFLQLQASGFTTPQ